MNDESFKIRELLKTFQRILWSGEQFFSAHIVIEK